MGNHTVGSALSVAFLVYHFPMLSEVFIANAAAGLARCGHHVDIIPVLGQTSSGMLRHPVDDELERSGNVDVRPVRYAHRPRRRLLAVPSALVRIAGGRGIPTATRTMSPALFGAEAFAGRSAMVADTIVSARASYDIVHCQFATLAPLALALRRAGVFAAPIVVHFRGYDITEHVAKRGDDVYADVFAHADGFIANCLAFRDRAIALGCDPGRIRVVTSGTDIAQFPFTERTPPDGGPIRILAVGRLVPKKGFLVAVEAMRRLVAWGSNVALEIVGEGEQRAAIERAIAVAGLADRIRLVGALAHGAIAERLRDATIFIAPSITGPGGDADAPVNTLKEAMASGTPVVASRHGGIPELVEHGVNGLLCAENDAADLAARIRELTLMSDRWPGLSRAARRTVELHHSLDVSTEGYLASYGAARRHASELRSGRERWNMRPSASHR